jgi:hypothetical protein
MLWRETAAPANDHLRSAWTLVEEHRAKLVQLAQEVYMVLCRDQLYGQQNKKVDSKAEHGQTQRLTLERKMHTNHDLLVNWLRDYDNARLAVQWLERYYGVLLRRHQLSEEMQTLRQETSKLESTTGTDSTLREQRLQLLRQRVAEVADELHKNVDAVYQLRKDSLAVGLQYLDANASGYIEPEDMPQLTAEIFTRLDLKQRHKISTQDLQKAVDTMTERARNLHGQVEELQCELQALHDEKRQLETKAIDSKVQLRAEGLQVEILKKTAQTEKLIKEQQDQEDVLRDIYTMFQKGFPEAIFKRLGQKLPGVSPVQELEGIERQFRDLQLDENLRRERDNDLAEHVRKTTELERVKSEPRESVAAEVEKSEVVKSGALQLEKQNT